MKDKYDNINNLRSFKGRIAVIGTERDEVIPVKHAEKLYANLTCIKKIWLIGGAGHNDWPMVMKSSQWRDVMNFIHYEDNNE